MKKRLLPLLIAALAAALLCSCGSTAQTDESSAFISQTTVTQTSAAVTSTSSFSQTESLTTETTFPVAATTALVTETTVTKTSTTESKVTLPQSTQKTTEKSGDFCILTIDCRNLLKNSESLKKSKRQFVPKSGYILKDVSVEVKKGETAFDILKRGCKENTCTDSCRYCENGGIQLEFSFTPAYQSYYVEGIHQLYEKDCGTISGWMFNVNGKYPDVSSSAYEVKPGDKITFAYTVSMGDDL